MQRLSDFVARGIPASISQLRNGRTALRSGTRVPKGGFAATKHPSKWHIGCETMDLQAWKIRSHFAAAKRAYLAMKRHSCAKVPFRSCENFHRGRKAAVKWFRSGNRFSQRLLRAAKFFRSGPL